MRVIAVIPARLGSTRLSRKMLREIAGIPMVGRVYARVRDCTELSDVIVATDSEQIYALCRQNSWTVEMTSPSHRSGTERVHEISDRVQADVYVNVQGDEVMVRPEQIADLLSLMRDPEISVGTLKTRASVEDFDNPNAVKVVTDLTGRALYFSRSSIPYDRDGSRPCYFKHLGFYAYRKPALDRFVSLAESSLEKSERLEQLRFLENGITIHVAETQFDSVGVDTEEDLKRAEALIVKQQS